MTTALDSSIASAGRRLALRARSDLVIAPQTIAGRRWWAVKDPIAMAYFRLREEELAVFEMLDGRTTAAEIIARYERRFAPRRLTPERLHAFVTRLHADGLIVGEAPGQGGQLLNRAAVGRRRRWLMNLANVLSLRFPGINPTPLLDRLSPLARVFFSPAAVSACLLLVVAAVVLVAVRFAEFEARLPGLQGYLTPRNALLALAAVSLVKVLHELGHALACRRWGGECHEVGPMLLVFAPCLYCDVSDSWMFESKWRRIAVAAAGIYVEAVLAAAATFLWWASAPGLTAALALNIMFVCSLSTLLFNGNPLLRYDGYYVLSDLVEIPNLAERSAMALRTFAARILFGLREPHEPNLTPWRRWFLIAYAVASITYRLILVVLLLWFCYRLLIPYRLETLAGLLAASVVAGTLAGPAVRLLRFVRTPKTTDRVPRGRVLAVVAGACFLAAVVALLPLPVRVTAPIVIEPESARRVYVAEPGRLDFAVRAGEQVAAGATLARLSNPDLELEITRLVGQRDLQRLRLANLERRRSQDRAAAAEIPTVRESLSDLEQRLASRQADQSRLTLTAPVAGTVLPPEWKTSSPLAGALPAWRGTPLIDRNRGATLETGTLLCLVGDPRNSEAVAIVDQADVERIAVGQRAEVKLDQSAGEILWGTVAEIAEIDLRVAPRTLAYAGGLPVRRDSSGAARPLSASYQVRVKLDPDQSPLLLGAPGRVRIHARPESVFTRWHRWLRGTFHFTA